MPSKKKSSKSEQNNEECIISPMKKIVVSAFNDNVYIHLFDSAKNKNVSLRKEEFENLVEHIPDIEKLIKAQLKYAKTSKALKSKSKKNLKSKSAKRAKLSSEEDTSSSGSDSD